METEPLLLSAQSLHNVLKQSSESHNGDAVASYLLYLTRNVSPSHPLNTRYNPALDNFPTDTLGELLATCCASAALRTLVVAINVPDVIKALDDDDMIKDADDQAVVLAKAMVNAVTAHGACLTLAIDAVSGNLQRLLEEIDADDYAEHRFYIFQATWQQVINYYAPPKNKVTSLSVTYSHVIVDAAGTRLKVRENGTPNVRLMRCLAS